MLQSNGPVTLSLPPFRGLTRKIVLWAGGLFLAFFVLGIFSADLKSHMDDLISLRPALVAHGLVWLPFTFSFAPLPSLLSMAFALFSIWIFGSMMEEEFGRRWLREYLVVATAGGGFLACLLSFALAGHVPQFDPPLNRAAGLWPAVMALLLAFARFHGEQEMRLYFAIRIKAKFVAAIYLLGYLFATLGGDRFDAVVALSVALCGWLHLRFAPRKGLQFATSEWWFGLRNSYIRSKRKRAGKKFEVYMKHQGKDVRVDMDGKGSRSDSNDKRWMN